MRHNVLHLKVSQTLASVKALILFYCVAVPPSIQPGPRVMKVQLGHPVELPCIVTGVPEPTISWTRDDKRYPVSADGGLVLRDVGLDDEGTYTCSATNTAGKDEARVQILVQGLSSWPVIRQRWWNMGTSYFSGLFLIFIKRSYMMSCIEGRQISSIFNFGGWLLVIDCACF